MSVADRRDVGSAADAVVGDHLDAGRKPRAVFAVAEAHVGALLLVLAGHEHAGVRALAVEAGDLVPLDAADADAQRAAVAVERARVRCRSGR